MFCLCSRIQQSLGFDQKRATTRFEPEPDATAAAMDLQDAVNTSSSATSSEKSGTSQKPKMSDTGDDETYTSRLLSAKQRAWKEKE